MAKRRAADSDEEDAAPPRANGAKRARFNGNGNGAGDSDVEMDDAPAPARKSKGKGKGKARARRDDDDDDEEFEKPEDAEVDEAAETQFEKDNEEQIRESVRQKQTIQGGVAKFGIIERVEMHQFMCHKYLTFNFGPQINFIIGHNGSGKSAVLSAITIALGGKANSTGRGNGLKSFIREGQGAAEVTITLKNQGDEAYRHDVYGDSIVISRRFTKEGASSYQIKSKGGHRISTKREELSAICDHMNIQVDNPMNVLTQDAARQFLGAAHPTEKYKFFLKGTQLSQLSEEYQTCTENVKRMQAIVDTKRGAIEDLETAYKEASVRFKEAQTAREHRHKVDRLKKELAWAHVATKEDELRGKVEATAKAERQVAKVQEKLDSAAASVEAASAEVEAKQLAHDEIGNIEHLHAQDNEFKVKIAALKKAIQGYKNDEANINNEMAFIRTQQEKIQEQKRVEQAKTASYQAGAHDALVQRLEDAKAALEAAQQTLTAAEALVTTKNEELQAARTAGEQGQRELRAAEEQASNTRQQREHVERNARDTLGAFGNNMQRVLEVIGRTRWNGSPPVGPLGKYVKVRDLQWAEVLRIQIGSLMSGFAVTDMRDRATLKRILQESNNGNANIVVAEVDLFDYSAGEPGPEHLTILRALDVSDEYVTRILINQGGVERTLLFHTRSAADDTLRAFGQGTGISRDLFRVQRYQGGGGSSNPMQKLRPNDNRQQLFTGRDSAAQIAHWREQEANAEAALADVRARTSGLRPAFDRVARELKEAQGAARRAHAELQKAKRQRDQLQQEVNDDVALETAGLDESLADLERDRAKMAERFAPIVEQRQAASAEVAELMKQQAAVKAQKEEFHARKQAAVEEVTVAVNVRLQAQSDAKSFTERLADERRKLESAREQEGIVREEFDNWSAKASEYCARVEGARKAAVVQRELDATAKALKDRERRDGATVEEMTVEVNRTHAALQKVKGELDELDALTLLLKKSLKTRVQKWLDFRRHIAFRCKVTFQFHLSNRGYFGKVLFDHINHTLELKVQTEDVMATQGAAGRERDPKGLSGGEKSFSTICLLLAMWESIGSPIRCLDEFDVFMDAVNRRISSKMIIDTANSSDGKQYVLITPQSMDNIHIGPTVRVHRMSDPERGQGTLAYGNSVA